MIRLYENIKYFRELKGMSQEKLAKLTGYTDRSSIAKIEKGLVDLQQSKIELFAKALDVSIITLVGWEDDSIVLTTSEMNLIRRYRKLDEHDRGFIEGQISLLSGKKESGMEGDVNVV